MLYDAQFPDGFIKPYSSNLIAENILMQADSDGLHHQLLEGILYHSKDKQEIEKKDKYFISKRGRQSMRKKTVGCKFNIKWRYGTTKLVSLKDLKKSNQIEVAEYFTARDIQEEPAFAWWVPCTLRKRDSIIDSANACVCKSSHKYGIEIPTSIKHAEEIDHRNKNIFWQDAIKLEMSNVGVAFKILERGDSPPPGYTKSSGHIVFDVCMSF